MIGESALSLQLENPDCVVANIKSILGISLEDAEKLKSTVPYTINTADDEISIDVKYAKDNTFEQITPEYIASLILLHLLDCAEAELHIKITNVILTCPAYFNVNQRHSLMIAAEMANMKVLKLINEPTAASLSFGFNYSAEVYDNNNILIFDYGGGTLDISILNITNNNGNSEYKVLNVNGNTTHGGNEITLLLANYIKDKIFKETNIRLLFSNPFILSKMINLSEEIKIELSDSESVTKSLNPLDIMNKTFKITITRNEFNNLIEKTMQEY